MSIQLSDRITTHFLYKRYSGGLYQQVKYTVTGNKEAVTPSNVQKIISFIHEMEQKVVVYKEKEKTFVRFDQTDLPRIAEVKSAYEKFIKDQGLLVEEIYDNTFECMPS